MWVVVCAIVMLQSVAIDSNSKELILKSEWTQLDFNFPSQIARNEAISLGWFIKENAFPIDVDVDVQGNISPLHY